MQHRHQRRPGRSNQKQFQFRFHIMSFFLIASVLFLQKPPELFWVSFNSSSLHAEDHSKSDIDNQFIVNQMMYRNHDHGQLLKTAEKFIHQQKYIDALSVLQVMFDSTEDSFHQKKHSSPPGSSRCKAYSFFENLSPDLIITYEKLFGPSAETSFKLAKKTHSTAAIREIVRRFFYTEAGFHATNWLGSRAFDHGNYQLANQYFKNLLNSSIHQSRITKTLRLKSELCQSLMQDGKPGWQTADLNSSKRVAYKIKPASAVQLINGHSNSEISTALYELQSQIVPGYQFSTNHFKATPPRLTPIWTHMFAQSENVLLKKLLDNWVEYQYEHSDPLSTVNYPVVAGNLIVYRDEKGLKAFDVKSGELKWNYNCLSSLYSATLNLHRKHGLSANNISRISSYFDLQHSYVGNSIQGSLSADGNRVYFVDGINYLNSGVTPYNNAFSPTHKKSSQRKGNNNILVALELNSEDGTNIQPVWKLGGSQKQSDQKNLTPDDSNDKKKLNELLAGHYFLGAPAIGDGVLYIITEFQRQLNLVAIDPEKGEILWFQGLGFVDKPIQLDRYRSTKACVPVISGGTILCPLSNGLLVAINSTTEQLMWSYYCGDDSSIAEYGSWGHHQSTFGSKGFYSHPYIQGSNIIYLPRTSKFVHCVDLQTGKSKWKIPRKDAEFIGTITKKGLLLIGKRYCKLISLRDGAVLWSISPGMPSGKGVCIGSSYLIPLQSGRISAIDIMTGNDVGLSQKYQSMQNDQVQLVSHQQVSSETKIANHWTPGNLSIANGLVISCAPGAITAFPQAGLLLEETEKRLEHNQPSVEDLVLAVELNLTLGQLLKARTLLTHILSQTRTAYQSRQTEKLFRELLNLELSRGIQPKRALYQLARLARTQVQQGEYLMLRSKHELERPQPDQIIQTANDLSSLKLDQPLVLSTSSRHLVAKESWIPHLILKASKEFQGGEKHGFLSSLKLSQNEALQTENSDAMRMFITKYSAFKESETVREKLALLLIKRGKYQEAEFLLVHNKSSENKTIAANACRHLVDLWAQHGLLDEAATLLHKMENQYQNIKLNDSMYVRDVRLKYSEESLLRNAYRQQNPISWNVNQVSIQETVWMDNNLGIENAFDHSRGRFWSSNNPSFHILNKSYNNQGQMALINRMSGVQVGAIKVPYRHDLPAKSSQCRSGHYLPIGSPVSMMGISLLEYHSKKPLWKSVPKGDVRPHVLMRAGPSGERFSVFQSHHTLVIVNPVNGKILWQRNDLEANSGLISDQYSGLIGDEKVLVLFGSDRHSYTVYDTLTGIVRYQGQLPKNENHLRNAFGRMFFYVVKNEDNRTVRIWDPLHNELLLDEEVTGQVYSSVTPDHKLVLGTFPDRVRILDVEKKVTCLDVKLGDDAFENLNYIRSFYDSGDYYLNMQRSTPTTSSRKFSYYASNSYLPVVSIQGELIAVNAKTGNIKWKMDFPQRSVIHLPHYQLPFLMTISRVRDPWNSSRQSLLIEIIDRKNGRSIGLKDNIFPDRILHLSYFPEKGLIELFGQNTKINLDFSRKQQKLALFHSSNNY